MHSSISRAYARARTHIPFCRFSLCFLPISFFRHSSARWTLLCKQNILSHLNTPIHMGAFMLRVAADRSARTLSTNTHTVSNIEHRSRRCCTLRFNFSLVLETNGFFSSFEPFLLLFNFVFHFAFAGALVHAMRRTLLCIGVILSHSTVYCFASIGRKTISRNR